MFSRIEKIKKALDKRHEIRKKNTEISMEENTKTVEALVHDLCGPLQRMVGAISNVIDTPFMNSNTDEHSDIRDVINRLDSDARIINNQISLAQISLQQRTTNSVDLIELMRELHTEHQRDAKNQDVVMNMYAPKTDIFVSVGEFALRTIMSNLILNAIKHNDKPSGKIVDISISVNKNTSELNVCVEDNGNGISDSKLSGLGTTAHAGAAGSNSTGLGVGLTFIQSLADANNIVLTWESKEGVGTTAYARIKTFSH